VRGAADYEAAARKLGILVDHDARRRRIEQLARSAAARRGWSVVEDDALLEELTFMLEDPRPLVGTFAERYLDLPAEVVTTAMRSHQRYLALRDRRERLVARFVTFTDGAVAAAAEVRRGNERVLRARLEDASFYWREDLKRGVDRLSDELDRIVFIEGLGTIGQKWRRTESLALAVNAQLAEPADPGLVRRAARLAKCDLASEMIKDGKEFTLLQGVIGSHYAREAGEDPAVVAAIREHYQPRGPADFVPRSPLSVALGVADRADTIAGCFIVDIKPTGSQDPYGLRRSANAIIRLVESEPGVALDVVADAALEGFARAALAESARVPAVRGDLAAFLQSRVEAFLKERRIPYDVAAAVIPPWWTRPGRALSWAGEIARMRGNTVFERLITGVKRVGNILSPAERRMGAP
jgi:glycyl-tRNA synthetase beta chain